MNNAIYEINSTWKIRSAYREFYDELKRKEAINYFYQLFPIAFLVGIMDGEKDTSTKTDDLFDVNQIRKDDLEIIKGIALLKIEDAENGNELFKEILAYADRGIQIIKEDYENDRVIRLDKYI